MKVKVKNDLIEWRRGETLTLYSTGMSLTAIAERLKVSVSLVSKDISLLRRRAMAKQAGYLERLPFEHEKSIASIERAHKELWALFEESKDPKLKRSILDSIGEIIIKRQILLGDPQHIDKALQAVAKIRRQLQEQQEQDMEAIQ